MKVVSVHSDFVQTRIFEMLLDGVGAISALGEGMELVPLLDYHLPSLFLKMTGALEQKMKCICWDLSSNDYEYRNSYLRDKLRVYGECSTYDSKQGVYKDLIEVISRINPEFVIDEIWEGIHIPATEEAAVLKEWEDKHINNTVVKAIASAGDISEEMKSTIRQRIMKNPNNTELLKKMMREAQKIHFLKEKLKLYKITIKTSSLAITFPRDYDGFLAKGDAWSKLSLLATIDKLFPEHLSELYTEEVYKHRNRCAHNLTSYQNNLPSLDVLANQKEGEDNYFVRFWLIILIDEIFMRLYKYYIDNAEYV